MNKIEIFQILGRLQAYSLPMPLNNSVHAYAPKLCEMLLKEFLFNYHKILDYQKLIIQ